MVNIHPMGQGYQVKGRFTRPAVGFISAGARMPNRISSATRSKMMSRIRGKDTLPELALRKLLWRAGLRYRLQAALPGRPDIAFPRQKMAIFVDGCFWHGCPDHYQRPATNRQLLDGKLKTNTRRDRKVDATLLAEGWAVVRFWEHYSGRTPL